MRALHAMMLSVVVLSGGVFQSSAMAQGGRDPAIDPPKVRVASSFPTSKLVGLNVRNEAGEKLGSVEDMVIGLTDGKVHYLALSFGGVLGIGDKLFAVPYQELQFNHGKDEMFFVLNISKEKLKAAPGFDKNNWPDFADPKWRQEIDAYYRAPARAARPDGTNR